MDNHLAIKIVLDGFKRSLKSASKLLNELPENDLLQEIVPTKNSGHYLLGHLIAVHDNMLPLLGLRDSLYPELMEVFIKKPDKSGLLKPSIAQLKQQWEEVHQLLVTHLESLTDEQWFEKHTAVSDEDFATEPHRNRLNVVLSRSNHLSYHIGQISLLRK
ncbi:DinB family protein [Flectobacillus longus]|uniref:DinB family protein n=1 Tax=Flectobacillus longus TaxID=2984207 RepID=UPI0024B7C63D|nr:DinB family protein [Flectobacillus longus]MDI9877819.1 DinB family protein [Flectobacillus longus]